MVDHAIFSKDGPNLSNPADTNKPRVIPKTYKLKKRNARGKPKSNKEMNTVYIYFIHLVFNTTWSITFFVFHNMLLALIVLIILIAFIINLILRFRRVKMISAYLMIPYLLWCCFALILNSSLIILN